jgi:hypothetical protein
MHPAATRGPEVSKHASRGKDLSWTDSPLTPPEVVWYKWRIHGTW